MKKKLFIALLSLGFLPATAKAHCPLCTVGAGALAVGAAYLGVSTIVVGILIGAFALALSLWIPKLIKKEYVPYQRPILVAVVFLSTIIPLMPLIREYQSFNIFLWGDYGSFMNRTYMYNKFVVGTVIGAFIMYASPYISSWVKKQRGGKLIPYQGIAITFVLLAIISLIIQLAL